jgi:molybdopterin synthase catalytic subunit
MIEIVDKPIEVQKIINAAYEDKGGAVNVFLGTVRNQTKGKKVIKLEYEAYEPMALKEIKKIIDEACKKWEVLNYGASHRIGTLNTGDIAVVIAISTPHRKESFEACQFIIDKLKETVPIWKREFFEDGDQWVSAHP